MASEKFDQIKYQDEYNRTHYDRIQVRVRKGEKSKLQNAAKEAGQSLNEYIIQAINERMERNG